MRYYITFWLVIIIVWILNLYNFLFYLLLIFLYSLSVLYISSFENKAINILLKKVFKLTLHFAVLFLANHLNINAWSMCVDYLLENGLDDVDESNDDEKKEKEKEKEKKGFVLTDNQKYYITRIALIAGCIIVIWILYKKIGGSWPPSDPSSESSSTNLTEGPKIDIPTAAVAAGKVLTEVINSEKGNPTILEELSSITKKEDDVTEIPQEANIRDFDLTRKLLKLPSMPEDPDYIKYMKERREIEKFTESVLHVDRLDSKILERSAHNITNFIEFFKHFEIYGKFIESNKFDLNLKPKHQELWNNVVENYNKVPRVWKILIKDIVEMHRNQNRNKV